MLFFTISLIPPTSYVTFGVPNEILSTNTMPYASACENNKLKFELDIILINFFSSFLFVLFIKPLKIISLSLIFFIFFAPIIVKDTSIFFLNILYP